MEYGVARREGPRQRCRGKGMTSSPSDPGRASPEAASPVVEGDPCRAFRRPHQVLEEGVLVHHISRLIHPPSRLCYKQKLLRLENVG